MAKLCCKCHIAFLFKIGQSFGILITKMVAFNLFTAKDNYWLFCGTWNLIYNRKLTSMELLTITVSLNIQVNTFWWCWSGCVLRLNRSKKISSYGRTQLIQTAETRWEGAEEKNQETAKAAIKKGRVTFVILKKNFDAAKAKVGLKHWPKI